MSLVRPSTPSALRTSRSVPHAALALVLVAGVISCGGTATGTTPPPTVANIAIQQQSFLLERGYDSVVTAVARNTLGTIVSVPFAWRSTNEAVATIDANGRVTALDTGLTGIYATSLGVQSQAIGVRVIFNSAAAIAISQFTPPSAVSPGAAPDSLHALVTNRVGGPVAGARVAFAVTAGGGTVSPLIATTNQAGIASAQWTLGSGFGKNSVTATVLGKNDIPFSFVSPNSVTYTLTTFAALVVSAGDAQTGLILSALPVKPSVKVVDSTGKPRAGVPVTFSAGAGGRIAVSITSTGADGTASPGVWTLGDIPGDQTLTATVDKATITLHATATGTPIHFTPLGIALASFSTCAIVMDGTVNCWGLQPNVGDSTTVNKSKPTPTKSQVQFSSIAGSAAPTSHFCGISKSAGIYCWGVNSLVDTTGKALTQVVPTLLPGTTSWTQVAPGGGHNCALAADNTVSCWGDNTFGQLADNTLTTRFAPAPVSGGFKFNYVASGNAHSCALSLDGSAFCWGANVNGQLGDGTTFGPRTAPTAVSGGNLFQSIAAGQASTCGLSTTGHVLCWGSLGTGQGVVTTPKAYPTAPIFTSITVGGGHECALTADGTAYCWGANGSGQVGDSTLVDRASPTLVATSLKFKTIVAGYAHTCALALDASMLCWGLNNYGELADSTASFRNTPRYIVTGVIP